MHYQTILSMIIYSNKYNNNSRLYSEPTRGGDGVACVKHPLYIYIISPCSTHIKTKGDIWD